jgi:hypothetical protein
MLYAIDLRTNRPRSAHEKLGGVKLLARVIDKGRATQDQRRILYGPCTGVRCGQCRTEVAVR